MYIYYNDAGCPTIKSKNHGVLGIKDVQDSRVVQGSNGIPESGVFKNLWRPGINGVSGSRVSH